LDVNITDTVDIFDTVDYDLERGEEQEEEQAEESKEEEQESPAKRSSRISYDGKSYL
jgi:hypothetical protein